jgi:hypothetical protein
MNFPKPQNDPRSQELPEDWLSNETQLLVVLKVQLNDSLFRKLRFVLSDW